MADNICRLIHHNKIMSDIAKISAIQAVLSVKVDGIWGPKTQAALEKALGIQDVPVVVEAHYNVWASSFADPEDVRKYYECLKRGGSVNDAKKVGDNGEGCWGDSTQEGSGASVALPPEIIEARWGSVDHGRLKRLMIIRKDEGAKHFKCEAKVKDRMPHIHNITNNARIDLNPDACAALGLKQPVMDPVTWWWLDEGQS